MIKIATPISHFFNDQNFAKQIINLSDCLEVRESSLHSKWTNKFLFHFDIDINLEWGQEIKNYLNQIFIKIKELKLVTFQLSRCCSGSNIQDGFYKIDGRVYNRQEMITNAQQNLEWLKKKLSTNIHIGLENNNYFPFEAYEYVTDGDFISEIILENNIFFLLDISHAIITSNNKKIEYSQYLKSLPLNKTVQIHISKPSISKDNYMIDSHDEPDKDIYNKMLFLIKEHKSIKYVTLEYYKDKKKLIDLIIELRNFIINLNYEK